MAFAAMESVRLAEQDAQSRIQDAVNSSDEAVLQAKKTYESIVSAATADAETAVAHSIKKATAKAEEITVTARNGALLEADELKSQCADRQPAVNKAILELIL